LLLTENKKEASKLPPSNLASLDHTDHVVMRKWLAEEYMNWPKTPPTAARSCEPVEIHKQTIPVTYGEDNRFSVRVYDPMRENSCSLRAALIMCHGGGWIHGYPEVDEGKLTADFCQNVPSPDDNIEFSEFFASELRAVVISLDYRLAPEHPFPQPLNDCYETIQWTFDHAAEYRIDTKRIGLWGCSAGGNLAAGIALRDALEHKAPRIAHVNLVVPVTCHPDWYPTILKTPASSERSFGFSGKDKSGLETLWGG
jgi:acetyl esterase/lipase